MILMWRRERAVVPFPGADDLVDACHSRPLFLSAKHCVQFGALFRSHDQVGTSKLSSDSQFNERTVPQPVAIVMTFPTNGRRKA